MLSLNSLNEKSCKEIWELFFNGMTPYELSNLYEKKLMKEDIHELIFKNILNDYPWNKYDDIPQSQEFRERVCSILEEYMYMYMDSKV